jgi:serine/threonine protein kinase/glutamine cyclotransferase
MGIVYRAFDARLKRKVALKLVAPELSGDERFRERFLAETEVAASLEHPNVVPIHDAGEIEGQLYLVMRYVEGSDLKALLHNAGALAPARALSICAQLAGALDAAHKRGLVHRDVKPSNVLLDSNEHVYLADFGLARRLAEPGIPTGPALSLGTPAYAAPEQIQGSEVDARTDQYSLGCVLYECLTGEAPYPRDSELAVLWAHVQEEPPRASERDTQLPEAIDPVLAKAMAKEPDDRYRGSQELVEAARQALGLRDVVLVRDRKPLLLTAVGALIAAGALAAGLVLTLGGGSGRPGPDLTVRPNSVVRIDPRTNKIASVTEVDNGPESMAIGGDTVWTYNWKDRTVSELDARTGALRRTIGIPGSSPLVQAQTIAANADDAWVISNTSRNGLVTHLRRSVVSIKREFPLEGDPLTIAFGDRALWVGVKTATRGSEVLRIDPDSGSVLTTVRLGASDVQSLALGEGALWALTQDGTLFRIDPASGRITNRKQLPTQGADAYEIAIGHGMIWADFINGGPTPLLRIDPRTLRVTATIRPPNASVAGLNFVLGDDAVWWNTDSTVSGSDVLRIEPRSGRIVSTIPLATARAEQLVRSPDGLTPTGMAAGAGSIWLTMSIFFSSTH